MAMLLIHLLALAGGPLLLSALLAALNKAVPDNPRGDPALVKQTLRVYDIVAVISVAGTLAIAAGLAYTGILLEMDGSAWLWALAFAAPTAWLVFWARADGERTAAEYASVVDLGRRGLGAKYIAGAMAALTMIDAIAALVVGIFY